MFEDIQLVRAWATMNPADGAQSLWCCAVALAPERGIWKSGNPGFKVVLEGHILRTSCFKDGTTEFPKGKQTHSKCGVSQPQGSP